MKTTHRPMLASAAVLCLMAGTLAYGQNSNELKGMIVQRSADSMTVRGTDAKTTVVLLSDDTKVQTPKGLGLRKQEVSWTELIPGLPVMVKGDTNSNGQIAAKQVLFTKSDLKTASMIQAGLTPTSKEVQANQQNIATNKTGIAANQQGITSNEQGIASNQTEIAGNQKEVSQRFADLADYETKGGAEVYFKPGSSTLAPDDKAALSALAATAMGVSGYMVQVKGFADASGSAAMNQQLSRDRAEAVIDYLMQDGKIPPRHIVAPGAMGISDPVASNETAEGMKENRRVEVKVLVNKGISDLATK